MIILKKPNAFEQAAVIVNYEARRKEGRIALYTLPGNDGGGKYEYAGINTRYHPGALDTIRKLLMLKEYDKAELLATEYIQKYTDHNAAYSTVPAIQFALRDAAFNRGPTGSVKIMQEALGVGIDGKVGPKTRAAMAEADKNPIKFLNAFREARESYERREAGYRENLWNGLVNRWDKQKRDSLLML